MLQLVKAALRVDSRRVGTRSAFKAATAKDEELDDRDHAGTQEQSEVAAEHTFSKQRAI